VTALKKKAASRSSHVGRKFLVTPFWTCTLERGEKCDERAAITIFAMSLLKMIRWERGWLKK
jgi:hypothetical protein